MKLSILVISILFEGILLAQNWTTITGPELGIVISTEHYIEVNRSDNSIWFGDDDTWYHIKDGILADNIYVTGLPGASLNDVTAITIIDDTIWASDKVAGLVTYDGTGITYISTPIKKGNNFYLDADDTLWVATGFNASEPYAFFGYKEGAFRSFNAWTSDLHSNNTFDIIKDSQGRIWTTHWTDFDEQGNGFAMLRDGVWRVETESISGFVTSDIVNVRETPENEILLTSKIGIFKFNETTEDFTLYNTSNTNMPTNDIRRFEIDSQGRMWGLFNDTAMAYTTDLVNWTPFYSWTSPILPHQILDFVIDTSDNVWILGYDRIWVYNPDGLTGWLGDAANEEEAAVNNFKLYPNPSNGVFTISNTTVMSNYTLFDLSGKQLKKGSINATSININQNLSKGIYILEIVHENGIVLRERINVL